MDSPGVGATARLGVDSRVGHDFLLRLSGGVAVTDHFQCLAAASHRGDTLVNTRIKNEKRALGIVHEDPARSRRHVEVIGGSWFPFWFGPRITRSVDAAALQERPVHSASKVPGEPLTAVNSSSPMQLRRPAVDAQAKAINLRRESRWLRLRFGICGSVEAGGFR